MDSNSLNKAFYDEFLHIIGLTEKKDGGDKAQLISRIPQASRNSGSLLENTISMVVNENAFTSREILEKYGTNAENRAFSIALELCLTWMNRILFLKLLESQLVDFHMGNRDYKFLNIDLVPDYDALNDLFFKVLAVRRDARDDDIQKLFKLVPYLNSSLFERTELEDRFRITALKNKAVMPIMKKTVLLDREGRRRTGDENTLSYLLAFLDAYDFGSVNDTGLKEASRTIINAAVLGLIFEKINGYQEGAIFTPGYITMYMARKVIQTTIIERFQGTYPSWGIKTLDDIAANIPNYSKETLAEMNAIIDGIKICDPAVGSGHFLVSSLNELIFVKAKIGILTDVEGNRIRDYDIDIENDELVVVNNQTDENFKYVVSGSRAATELQKIQKALFHQKQKLIENCLFGVDINPNSVRICQLRLWIELLKNAYYKDDDSGDLETLPNIDINIKCGNSLLSRFSLDENLSFALQKANMSVSQYKSLVASYKETKDKETKREIEAKISELKSKLQSEGIAKKTQQIDTELASLRNEERQLGLFSAGDGTQEEQKRLDEIHARIEAEEAKKAKLVKSQVFKSAFEWRFEFPEVLDNSGSFSGFDIIIANPPYMNIQGIESSQAEQKEYYSQKYTTARGSYDLANLFFELASWIANPHNGNCIFIFPHKAFNSASASPLRERFVQRRSIKHLVHFGANQIFENAITYTCVALFNDRQVDGFKLLKFPFKADFKSQLYEEGLFKDVSYASISEASEMYGSNQWIFLNGESQYSLFSKLYGAGSSVAEKFSDVFQGIATSKDCLFISEVLDSNETKFLIRVNPDEAVEKIPVPTRDYWVEKEFFKPFLMGRDVHRYSPLKTNRLVFFPYKSDDGYRTVTLKELKDSYPGTYRFVTDYEEAFKARESGKAGRLPEWHAYIYPKNREKFGLEKLVSMEICTKGANTTIDTDGMYHTTKVYSFVKRDTTTERYEYFSAIFNSKLFWWFLVNTGDTLQNDARTMKTNYVNPFPLPANVDSTIEAEIVEKVRELMLEKAANPESARIHDLERELDYAVYELYGLTEDDRLEVESSG